MVSNSYGKLNDWLLHIPRFCFFICSGRVVFSCKALNISWCNAYQFYSLIW